MSLEQEPAVAALRARFREQSLLMFANIFADAYSEATRNASRGIVGLAEEHPDLRVPIDQARGVKAEMMSAVLMGLCAEVWSRIGTALGPASEVPDEAVARETERALRAMADAVASGAFQRGELLAYTVMPQ